MRTVLLLTIATCVGVFGMNPAYGEESPKAITVPAAAAAPASAPGAAFTIGRQPMFQPISAEDQALVRQSMQARAEYDELNRRIMARQSKLYEENAQIKALQNQLRDLQKKIDKLLAADEELNTLKKKHAALTPEIPMGARQGSLTNASPFAPGR